MKNADLSRLRQETVLISLPEHRFEYQNL